MDELLYQMIFKRKSFHIMKSDLLITNDEINEIYQIYEELIPLYDDIRTRIKIVEIEKTNCPRGQYCILFYSEVKEGYEANIGYLGQQIDLYLASINIGTCWYGIGKTNMMLEDMVFVIMMTMQKQQEKMFRKDMFKSKRKDIKDIWQNDHYLDIANIVRFAPSSCNTQPWFVEAKNNNLLVFRTKGKKGIIPKDKLSYYNRIDMGIFLLILELCLKHGNYQYIRTLYLDNDDDVKLRFANYEILN